MTLKDKVLKNDLRMAIKNVNHSQVETKSAKEMFEELGYLKDNRWDGDTIAYKHTKDNNLIFFEVLKNKEIIFWNTDNHFNAVENMAITQQIKELGNA